MLSIYFDSWTDIILMLKNNPTTGRYHPRPIKESHTTITSEPDGAYRYHFTAEKPIPPHKPAYMEALGLVNWMNEKGIKPEVLGGDSTNPNTGWAGGCLCWVEKLMWRKVFWVVCFMYCNELVMRHLK